MPQAELLGLNLPLSPIFRGRSLGDAPLRDSIQSKSLSQRPLRARAKRARDSLKSFFAGNSSRILS